MKKRKDLACEPITKVTKIKQKIRWKWKRKKHNSMPF